MLVLIHEALTKRILDSAFSVHRALGPGLLESAYESCLCRDLELQGLSIERQVPLPVTYHGVKVECGYRLDVVVEDAVILELKCVAKVTPLHEAQLLTYLKLSRKRVGLMINFNVEVLKRGIFRRVL